MLSKMKNGLDLLVWKEIEFTFNFV